LTSDALKVAGSILEASLACQEKPNYEAYLLDMFKKQSTVGFQQDEPDDETSETVQELSLPGGSQQKD
jgi:hypothetical protein